MLGGVLLPGQQKQVGGELQNYFSDSKVGVILSAWCEFYSVAMTGSTAPWNADFAYYSVVVCLWGRCLYTGVTWGGRGTAIYICGLQLLLCFVQGAQFCIVAGRICRPSNS